MNRHWHQVLAASIVVSSCWMPSLAARADDQPGLANMGAADMSDERARAHFKAGNSLYDSGRFPEAAEEWEQAYALSKREPLLYNIYVAHRDASNLPKAIDALQRYLATNDPDSAQRLNLEARLRSMQAALAAQEKQNAAEAPAPAPPAAQPTPAAAPSTAANSDGGLPVLPLALVITGGALMTGSLVTGLLTSSKVSDLEDDCPNDVCPKGYDLRGPRDSARTLATVTDVLLASGVVVAGVGVVLWLTGDDASDETAAAGASARVLPSFACSTSGCVALVRGSL